MKELTPFEKNKKSNKDHALFLETLLITQDLVRMIKNSDKKLAKFNDHIANFTYDINDDPITGFVIAFTKIDAVGNVIAGGAPVPPAI